MQSFDNIIEGGVCFPRGFEASAVKAGIKASGNLDLALLYTKEPARCFAVFTKNQVQAAPVLFDKEVLAAHKFVNAVIVNSGNANACTGPQGYGNAQKMSAITERELGLPEGSTLVCSTGVIGKQLQIEKIESSVPALVKGLGENNSEIFAKAICTTDTMQKTAAVAIKTSKGELRIGGACKGSGMIHPNMATMLAYITTDLSLPDSFSEEFKAMINASFNAITVDGDTSTNDTCILLSRQSEITLDDLTLSEQAEFRDGLLELMRYLALQIVRDGEGATKTVEVEVRGARTKAEAMQVAKAIAGSNLVKCAIFGQDPNWGRIVSSAGASGVQFSPNKISLFFENTEVVKDGIPVNVAANILREIVQKKEYRISLNLNTGDAIASAYTCDLSYDYVKINAEYTT